MNREMTLFALGANSEGLGASGLAVGCAGPVGARAVRERRPALWRSPARATPVKPAPAGERTARRVRPQKVLGGRLLVAVVVRSLGCCCRSLPRVWVQETE